LRPRRPIRELVLNYKPTTARNVKVLNHKDGNVDIEVFGQHIIKAYKLYNGKVNPNSIEIVKLFAKHVYQDIQLGNLYEVIDINTFNTLKFEFAELKVSKELYFRILNENNKTLFAAKFLSKDTSSTYDVFGTGDKMYNARAGIQEVLQKIQSIIIIEPKAVYNMFVEMEFLTQEIACDTKVFYYLHQDEDVLEILNYKTQFKLLRLSFKEVAVGKRRRMVIKKALPSVTFDDVYCMDDIVEQFHEIGRLLNQGSELKSKGIHIPYGVLLVGAPGSGKTLVANAFANTYGIQMIEPRVDEFGPLAGTLDWVSTFRNARLHKPSIIFIDEIDKINHTQQLFTEMDGQISNDGVLVIACANSIDKIHPALLRPGRFDRKIYFRPLSNETKATILIKTLEKNQTPYDIDFDYIIDFMGDVNGAHIDAYVNEARIKMELNNIDVLTNELLLQTIEFVNEGYATPRTVTVYEKYQTIVHEAGHAVVAIALYGKDAVTKIDCRDNEYSLGRVQLSSKIPNHNQTEILNRVRISLGGLLAEKIHIGEAGFGASSDISKARFLLEQMLLYNGLDDLKYTGAKMINTFTDKGTEKSKDLVIEKANEILSRCESDVAEILNQNSALLNEIIDALKVKPLLLKEDIQKLKIDHKVLNTSLNHQMSLNKETGE